MRSLISLALVWRVPLGPAHAAELPYFSVPPTIPARGRKSSLPSASSGNRWPRADLVARTGAPASVEWNGRVEKGAILILEGDPRWPTCRLPPRQGERAGQQPDRRPPSQASHRLENGLELPVSNCRRARRFSRANAGTGAPMTAGMRRGAGAVLWVAVPPGERVRALSVPARGALRSGDGPAVRSSGCGPFSIRPTGRAWTCPTSRRAGASRNRRLARAAWHFHEPDAGRDGYLAKLIEACHREGSLVYAWFELPHVASSSGRPSRVARKDRRASGRSTRLAQAHEPDQPRLFRAVQTG